MFPWQHAAFFFFIGSVPLMFNLFQVTTYMNYNNPKTGRQYLALL